MYTLLTTGDVPGAATYFNPLLQQSIINCTSGTRPSSPPDGMAIWETDTERYTTWNASAGLWLNLGQMLTGAWTPALTAASVNPTLGSGSAVGGRYTLRNGNWCDARGLIKFGTSGTAAGTGSYSISLPFAAANQLTAGNTPIGSLYLLDSSASAAFIGVGFIAASATTMSGLIGGSPTAGPSQMSPTVPMPWAASDYVGFTVSYETA